VLGGRVPDDRVEHSVATLSTGCASRAKSCPVLWKPARLAELPPRRGIEPRKQRTLLGLMIVPSDAAYTWVVES
jgi:hypothetical protein